MQLERLIETERDTVISRLASLLGGDGHAAEDLAQEAFARAWRDLPVGLGAAQQRAWLHRTSLARLSAHERFVLLLRFEGGFTHAEIARLLDTTEEAARKRVSRARTAFVGAYRAMRANPTPLVLLISSDDSPVPYVRWLEQAGARVRQMRQAPSERELALADGLVVSGAFRDVHAGLYGETPVGARGEPNFAEDRIDVAVLNAALALDLPTLGICRGHQLLNIAGGGSLYQDVTRDGATRLDHAAAEHTIETSADGTLRRIVGRSLRVHSDHHQAIRRLGRNLRVVGASPDGLIETIQRDDRRFALGLQWHPELDPDRGGDLLAAAFVESMQEPAA